MVSLRTKPKSLPILSSYEHITIAGRGVEKRMALHPIVEPGTYQTTLKLLQRGEPLKTDPSLKWQGKHDQIIATATALEAILKSPQVEYNERQINFNYRQFEACDVRFFKFRNMPYNDTAELVIYFHGYPIDSDHLKYHVKIEDSVDRMVEVYANFLQQLHLCDRQTAINCAKSAKEQG